MRTQGYEVAEWWSWNGDWAVWRRLRFGLSVLVWRGPSRDMAEHIAYTLALASTPAFKPREETAS